ncbi:tripartite tricarboxylate transporter substrate-binding protein, partial [Salmonella enterica]|nr:tripartite tricarboxylate transporter substrate-binding protein [Salmonella enterica]
TTNHLVSELLHSLTGARWTTAQYKGNAPATTDLLGGHVDYLFADLSVVTSFMHSGKLKGIAFTGQARSKDFPDVPTLAELGYRN